MKRQRGITLSGVLFFMFLVGFVAYGAARVMPGYMDYWTLQRILKNVLQDADIKTLKDSAIRTKFATELRINNMDGSLNDQLQIDWLPNGVQLSVEFSMQRPFMGPVNLCMNFRAEETKQ